MKLKLRVVLLLLLSVTFSLMYIVAIQLGWKEPQDSPGPVAHNPAIRNPASVLVLTSSAANITPSEHSEASRTIPALDQKTRVFSNNSNNLTLVGQQLRVSPWVAEQDPWAIWNHWVVPNFMYPENSFESEEMNHILATMATAPITSFGVGHKGTQLKATAMLGGQRTVFKPKR